jgi:hypothetical protein
VAFRDGKLIPTMQKGIAGGFANPPQETELPLYKLKTA